MAGMNPGPANIAFDSQSRQPLINADVSWDENTPLEDIQKNFQAVGDQYNQFVQNAVGNVADRQTEHIGNNFGASPYNEHTYYEPGATSFASAMRQQGTQAAFEEGMTRGIREAQDKLNAAKNAYNNASTAYNDALNKYQQSKNNVTYSTIDKSLLPEGVNEDEFANYISAEDDAVRGLALSVGNAQLDSAVKNWNDPDIIEQTRHALGENSDAWQAYMRHMEERAKEGSDGVSERFGDTLEGRQWANEYVKAYYRRYYDDDFAKAYEDSYYKLSSWVYDMYETKTGTSPWDTARIPVLDLPDNTTGFEWQYIDIIQPNINEYKELEVESFQDGKYRIAGQEYTEEQVREKLAEAWGVADKQELENRINEGLATGGRKMSITEEGWNWYRGEIKNAYSKDIEAFTGAYEGFARVASITADDVAESLLGVTVQEAQRISQMQRENPDGFKKLSDSIVRSISDVSVFDVADGEREFFVDGKWQKLEAGTVVAHVPEGALDADGKVIDEDLKKMVEIFQSKDDPTLDEEKAAEEFDAAREKYALRVIRARALSNQTDGSIDKEIYGAFLLYDDWSTYKDKVKIGDKTAEEVLDEFRGKIDSNPQEAYDEFTKLWEQAYQNLGYFFKQGENGVEAQSLYDANGNPTIGRVEETKDGLKYNKRSDVNVEANHAMALITLYAGSMDRYNSGSKSGNINPDFLKKDGSEWLETTWMDMLRNIEADVTAISGAISTAFNVLGDAITGGQEARKYNGDIQAYLNDLGEKSGVITFGDNGQAKNVKNALEGKLFGEGSLGYSQERENQAGLNISQALNPLSDMIWGLNEGKGSSLRDQGWDWVGNFTSGMVSFGGTMVAEAFLGSLLKAGAAVAVNGVKSLAARGARALLNGIQGISAKSVLESATRGAVADLMNPTEDIMQRYVGKSAVNAADDALRATTSLADDVAGAAVKAAGSSVDDAAEQISKQTAGSLIEGAKMVPSIDQLDDMGKAAIKSLNATANDTTNWFMRTLSKMANVSTNLDNFAIKFSEKAMSYITPQGIREAMVKQGFSGITDDVVELAYQTTKRNMKEIGLAAAQMPYQNAVVAAFTGMAPEMVANAGDDVTKYLSKIIGDYYEKGATGFWRGVGEQGGKRTMDGVKKAFRDILEASMTAEANVANGLRGAAKLSTDDVVRMLARNGWDSKRIQLMAKEMLLSRGAVLEDMARDLTYGYLIPQMDSNMETHNMDASQWVSSGKWLDPIKQALIFKGAGAVLRRGQAAIINKQLDKAYRALSATALDTDGYAAKAMRVQQLSNKADRLANKMLDKSLDFGHMNDLSKRAADMVEDANKKMLEGLKTRAFEVDPKFNADTFEQFAEWLKKRPQANEALVTLYKNSLINATNFFEKFARSMGYYDGPGRLSTLEDPKIIGEIWDTLDDVAAKNLHSIKNNARYKTIWDKQAAMRKLQKKAVMDRLRDVNGIPLVRDLESSLDSMFEAWDDVAKRNVADGLMSESKIRLGFLPTAGILIGEADDGVPQALRGLVLGDAKGSGIATTVADPTMQREINVRDLIKAFRNGETEYTYSTKSFVTKVGKDGKKYTKEVITQHTVPVNPKGFNFLDATVAYRNANDLHRTVGDVLGTGSTTMGKAALQNNYVQLDGEMLSKSAADLDRTLLGQDLEKFNSIITERSKENMTKKLAQEQARARKALSKHAKMEDNILRAMGQQEARAQALTDKATRLMQEAKQGRRPEGIRSMAEILGLDEKNYKKITDDARAKVVEDIKKIQKGEDPYGVSTDTLYRAAITEAARRDGSFDYDLVARRILLDNIDKASTNVNDYGVFDTPQASVLVKGSVKNVSAAEQAGEGINVLRKAGTNEHYGNPFSPLEKSNASVKTKTIAEAVNNYRDWLDGTKFQDVEPERRAWILNQIESGELNGKKLLYYTENVTGGDYFGDGTKIAKYGKDAPSHADVLAELVNARNNGTAPTNTSGVTKIISGGQTGVDSIGLQVARKLGIETGGTAPKKFAREYNTDGMNLLDYGLKEIDNATEAKYAGFSKTKNRYTGRTVANVADSDGTVYFRTAGDTAGYLATKSAADKLGKPFLDNPTAEQLSAWLKNNNIQTLNVAGNRGSKLGKDNQTAKILEEALTGKFSGDPKLVSGIDANGMERGITKEIAEFNTRATKLTGKTMEQLSSMNMDNAKDAAEVKKAITALVHDKTPSSSIDRLLTDNMAQATTIMKDATKDIDDGIEDGGFARGFFTYIQTLDRLMPGPDEYNRAVELKLDSKLKNFGEHNITQADIEDAILETITVRKAAGDDVSDLITAYRVAKGIEGSSQRAEGLGEFQYGGKREIDADNFDDEVLDGSGIGEAKTNMGGSAPADTGFRATNIDRATQGRLDAFFDKEFKAKSYKGNHGDVDGIPARFFTKDEMSRVQIAEMQSLVRGGEDSLAGVSYKQRIELTRNARTRYNDYLEKSKLDKYSDADKIGVEVDENIFTTKPAAELMEDLQTYRDVLNKLTNKRSPYFNQMLQDKKDLFKSSMDEFKSIREDINGLAQTLAQTDEETKSLIANEVTRRKTRQKSYGKSVVENSAHDAAAALGISRPALAVTYGSNPARYNAISAAMKDGTDQASSIVHHARQGSADASVHHAKSIFDLYRNPGDVDVSQLYAISNMDAGNPAGVYHQLDVALSYLEEKGVDVSKQRAKLDEVGSRLPSLDDYGDIYGTISNPEMSLYAALAEMPEKSSYFPKGLLNGVDSYKRVTPGYVSEFTPTEFKIEGTNLPDLHLEVEYSAGSTIPTDAFATMKTDTGGDQVFLYVVDASGKRYTDEIPSSAFDQISKQLSQDSDKLRLVKDEPSGGLSGAKTKGVNDTNTVFVQMQDPKPHLLEYMVEDKPEDTLKRLKDMREKADLLADRHQDKLDPENVKLIKDKLDELIAKYQQPKKELSKAEQKAAKKAAKEEAKKVAAEEAERAARIAEAQEYLKTHEAIDATDQQRPNYFLESIDDFEDEGTTPFRSSSLDEFWTEYLIGSQNKRTTDDLMAEVDKLTKQSKRAQSKARQLGEQRLEMEDSDSGTTVNKALKNANLNTDPKRWLNADEYAKYSDIKAKYDAADNFLNGKANIYHSIDGGTYTPSGAGYSNFVRVSDYLKTLGYEVGQDGSWDVSGNATRKEMTKSLKKSYQAAKKNWGKAVDNPVGLPEGMDAASAKKTVANILKFVNQVRDASHATITDMDRIWVDRSYLELLSRFDDMPLQARGIMKKLGTLSSWTQTIQQSQLAGGFGAVNALTLRQAFSAVMEDPKKIFSFIKMFYNFRNSKASLNMIMERKDILTKLALRSTDDSIVTDLIPAMSKRVGRDDGGVFQTLATHTLDWLDPDKTMAHVPKGIRENLSQYITEWFEDPTFQVAMPIMRAQMMVDNYDSALSHFRKKYAKRIGVDMTLEEVDDAAMMVAYNRTQKFFTPHKYWSANYEEGMKRIKNESIRATVSKITGEGKPTTIMDLATNAFFALRYKQTFANRTAQGFMELAKQPFYKLKGITDLDAETRYMIGKGQANGIKTMFGLTALAYVWCTAMGIPTAFEDFDFTPEGDEQFHMPSVLTKFQNMGQIWLPNDTREDGTPYVNTSKTAYKLDPFFSMFTMPNTMTKTVDAIFNGNTTKYKAPQRGLPFLSVNNPINQFINSAPMRAVGDELIASNLLSPFRAMYEVIVNGTYFGNNIWEKAKLPDGRDNPNYDPGRNIASSVMHILGLDEVLDPNGYNRWVKGGDDMVKQDQVGTIAGTGILQHEYFTAAMALLSGDIMEAAVTAGELPIKTEKLSSGARTNMNTVVKNALDHYGDEYRRVVESGASQSEIDKAYAKYMKKSADAVQKWNAKYGYLLGENQELVPAMTRLVTAMTSGEYDDAMAYIQHAYWKASQTLKLEQGQNVFMNDDELSQWIADGGTAEEFVAEKNRRSKAYNDALDDEYEARKALREAGIPEQYLESASYEDLRAEQRSISRKIYEGIIMEFAKPVGEFDNYKEMQAYYEEMIANTTSKNTKVKLAQQYNTNVLDIIAKAIHDYGPGVLTESSVDRRGIAQQISDYLILPADKYYTGKQPKTNFLRDVFGVGYRNKVNLPSDDEYAEEMKNVASLMSKGKTASAMSKIESVVNNVKNGRLYVSDVDYSKLIQLKSMLRSKQ